MKYIDEWIVKGYIPGVQKSDSGEVLIPDSARRPYTKGKITANTSTTHIRAIFVKATINKMSLTYNQCYMTEKEYNDMIQELVDIGIVRPRIEDGITYYDSTALADKWLNMRLGKIERIIDRVVASFGEGSTRAVLDRIEKL